jgi:hypothetical protein
VPLERAPTIGKTINRAGIRTKAKKTSIVKESLAVLTLKSLNFLSAKGQTLFTGNLNLGPSNLIPR